LTATDAQLNEFVGLKKLAPYRDQQLKQNDIRKYGKKKRLREWRKKVEAEGQDEEVKAFLRPEKPKTGDLAVVAVPEKRKKKHKSRKGKSNEVVA
jgi:protein KRI1